MKEHETIDWTAAFASRAERMRASEIRELLKVLEQPGIISFAGGIPDPALFPTELIAKAYQAALADSARAGAAMQYSVSEGYLPLRRWIVEHMARRGVACDADNIVITAGSQQGLDFLGRLFLSPGDTALVTAPTYLGALQAFNAYEPRYDTLLPLNRDASPEAYLERAKGSRVALAYAVTDFANPSGNTLSEAERRSLLDLTTELGIPLVEDAAYEALRFEGERVPSCLSLDIAAKGHIDRSNVVYCGTFSKTIVPGLRVGWICASRDLVRKLVLVKQASDLHCSTINQMVIHEVASDCHDSHVEEIKGVYASRRDAMLQALDEMMPKSASWTRPRGGMFIWLQLPAGLDGAELLGTALREEKIAFVPGNAFFAEGGGHSFIRLNYSLASVDVIREGIGRLARLIERQIKAPSPGNQTRAA
jgi:DNA-binding transcriptional MocR family regulator